MLAARRIDISEVEEAGVLERVLGGTALSSISVLAVMGTIAAGFQHVGVI